jgi:O-antigen/teichoic acid export membrane protein
MKNADNVVTRLIKGYKYNDLFKRFVSVLSIDVAFRLSGILLLPVFLLLMSQKEYGLYNYILTLVTNVSVIICFGLYVSQSKYFNDATSAETKGKVLFNIFLAVSLLTTLILLLLYSFGLDYTLIRFFFKNDINYDLYRWPILLAIIVSAFSLMLTNFFITSEKIKHFRWFNIVRLVLVNSLALAGLYFFALDKINGRLLYTYITEMAILCFFMIFYLKEMLPQIDWSIMKRSLKLGLPVMIAAIWSVMANNSEKFVLEKTGSGGVDLSYYYLAFSISNVIYMICVAIQNVWLPTFLKEKDLSKNIAQTKKLLLSLFFILLFVSALIFAGFYIVIVIGIIDKSYMPALYILPIMLLAQVLSGLLQLYANYFIYLEKTQWGLLISIFTSVVGLGLSYLMIPSWTIFGASLTFLGVQLTYLVLYYFVINWRIKKHLSLANNQQT